MSTRRDCLFKKTEKPREKGCQNEAKWRVVLGKGYSIDVCDYHKKEYELVGLKIIPLEESVVSESR